MPRPQAFLILIAAAALPIGARAEPVAPLLTAPVHADAIRAYYRGDYAGAAQAFSAAARAETPSLGRDAARFWYAKALAAQGDFTQAARYMAAVELPTTWDTYYAATWALEAGDMPAYEKLWQQAEDTIRCVSPVGKPCKPRTALTETLEPGSEEALTRALLAALKKSPPDAAAARPPAVELWSRFPAAPGTLAALEFFAHEGIDLNNDVGLAALRQRAQALLEAHDNAGAQQILEAIIPALKGDARCEARVNLGRALRKLRLYKKASAALKKAIETCGQHPEAAAAHYLYAFIGSIGDAAVRVGVPRWLALQKLFPVSPLADDALFEAGEAHRRLGDNAAASAAYERLLKLYPQGDMAAEALWRLAWIALRTAKFAPGPPSVAARHRLIDLRHRHADHGALDEWARATYWLARIDPGERGLLVRELLERKPGSFYGFLATRQWVPPERFEELTGAPPKARDKARAQAASRLPFDGRLLAERATAASGLWDEALATAALGLRDETARELAFVLGGAGAAVALTPADYETAAQIFALAGDLAESQWTVRRNLKDQLRGQPKFTGIWPLAYPLAYHPEIRQAEDANGIPVFLFQSLVREESAYKAEIVSWAGALGLSQLMPGTAAEEARLMKLPEPAREDILAAELNLRIGGHHFGRLLKIFQGNAAYALAAYNAGAGNVRKWLGNEKLAGLPLDAFIEEIPLTETRDYVKRILGTYFTHWLLYGSGKQPADLGLGSGPG